MLTFCTVRSYHFLFSSIGVCCPDEISDKASAVNLPENGDFDAIVWGGDNNMEASEPEAIISRPEERGSF